jgi:hypothetical protein
LNQRPACSAFFELLAGPGSLDLSPSGRPIFMQPVSPDSAHRPLSRQGFEPQWNVKHC